MTLAICFGTAVAFLKAERRITAAQQAQRQPPTRAAGDGVAATGAQSPPAQVPAQQDIGEATRLCGNVDVHVRKTVTQGELVSLLQHVETVIVDGPDFGGIVRLRIFARDPQRALADMQRSGLLDAVTPLPYCR